MDDINIDLHDEPVNLELSDGDINILLDSPSGSIAAVWGAIGGTLSDQEDLQAAFDLKLDSADFNLSTFDTDDLTEGSTNLYDQTVSISGGSNVTIGGTYPNFTITDNSASSSNLSSHTGNSAIHFEQSEISIPASQINDFDTEVSNNSDVSANTSHRGTTSGNPHSVSKSDVGLGNVPNVDCTNASNISSGTLPSSVIPAIAISETNVVASEAAQLALSAQEGDVAVRSDENKSYIHNGGTAGTMADWTELLTPTDAVLSVNGETGAVILTQDDVGDGSTYGRLTNTQITDLTDAGDSTLHYHAADRNRSNHTGTQTASTISDFDTEVANNSAVAANTEKVGYTDELAQDAVGNILSDSSEIDFTYTDATPSITASIIASSIDETKLDTSVNASLDLADSSLQSSDIGVSVQGYDSDTAKYDDTTANFTGTLQNGGSNVLVDSDIGTNVQAYSSVLANTTASFQTADETKLDGIESGADVTDATNVDAAGAVMNSDTTTASMSFVIDEDTMTSDSATKVPTQQSVKAYVDNQNFLSSETAGATNGNAVYLSGSHTWAATDASATSTSTGLIGIQISSTEVQIGGIYTTTGLTAGSIYYLSETTGGITTTAPTTSGAVVRIIGYALSTTELLINPDKSWVVVA